MTTKLAPIDAGSFFQAIIEATSAKLLARLTHNRKDGKVQLQVSPAAQLMRFMFHMRFQTPLNDIEYQIGQNSVDFTISGPIHFWVVNNARRSFQAPFKFHRVEGRKALEAEIPLNILKSCVARMMGVGEKQLYFGRREAETFLAHLSGDRAMCSRTTAIVGSLVNESLMALRRR